VSHAHLHSVAQFTLIPRLALIGRHLSREYGDPDAFLRQNAFEPTRYVPLCRVYGINLAFSAAGEVRLDALHQLALLRVGEVLAEVLCLSDQKWHASMQLRVVLGSDQIAEAVRPIRIAEQCIEGRADHGMVSSMLFERLFDLLFEIRICFRQRLVHVNADDFFAIGRQFTGDVFQRDERAEFHEKLAEQQWRCTRFAFDLLGHLRFRAGILFGGNDRHSLEDAVALREVADTRLAPLVAFCHHLVWFQAIEHIEKIVGVTAHEGSGKYGDSVHRPRHGP